MGEKTLPPTPQRIQQAREDGQVGVSEEAVRIIKLLVMAEFAFAIEPWWRRMLSDMLDAALLAVSSHQPIQLRPSWDTVLPVALSLLLLAVMPMLLAAITTLAQTRFNVAPKALAKGLEKLDIGNNLQQLVSAQKLLVPFLGPIKGGLLLWMVYLELREQFPLLAQAYRLSPAQGWSLTLALMHSLLMQCVVVLIILMIADILLQRYLVWRQLRMDVSETKQDYKQSEGDPMLKGMRKQTAKEIALEDAPGGKGKQRPSAVVVNPEHIAVALLYEPESMDLPVLMAATTDDDARDLRRMAREERVPIIKYVALARHLLASGKAGEPIPEHTYRAAALLFRVLEEYERLAPELLHPPGDWDSDGDENGDAGDTPKVGEWLLAEVDDALGTAMFDTP
ncbi:EscU/YscU/HrcU family type III secretion system export apparatus switch protein [Roseateles sp. SL47]|uniref:EscU/YscU/HrcU family type III secretion system export apparatus switch protein n=1 Tax=Roseateles sp. SL47 TaxID=2995138 RepID=UPI00226FEF85|nr:EscU/YscU/HrcU family type III secretion system export apparatus switch protein [Roseateles sp. SL47]WAC75183.1 EscU/YscU/HrcU family type III secretion system export apparatus switch protein [Roseateles sp. SL47]